MKVNEKKIYSSIEVTEEERNFCRKLFEVAEGFADELDMDTTEVLYDIVGNIRDYGHVDFDDWR